MSTRSPVAGEDPEEVLTILVVAPSLLPRTAHLLLLLLIGVKAERLNNAELGQL